jgi:hypothetical protein
MPRADQGIKDHRYHVIPRTLIFLFNIREQVLLIKGACCTNPLIRVLGINLVKLSKNQ